MTEEVDPRRLIPPLLAAVLSLGLALGIAEPVRAAVVFFDPLAEPTEGSLITNEYAHWNPGRGVDSPRWQMTSGSLFAGGWTGVPDTCAPDRLSSPCTNSAVFRLTTRRSDFGAVRVDAQLRANGWAVSSGDAWDGVHLFLRYRDEASLYYASVARRDGRVLVKKKCPDGGPGNGGTYGTIGSSPTLPFPLGAWRAIGASVDTAADGSVAIEIFRDGTRVVRAIDRGEGCPPITAAGAVGVRGDQLDFNVRDFTVSELHPAPAQSRPVPAPTQPTPAGSAPGRAPPHGASPAGPAPAGPVTSDPPVSGRAGSLRVRTSTRSFRRALRVRVRAGARAKRVTVHLGRRRVSTDRRAPFRIRVRAPRRLRPGVHRLRVTAYDRRGRRLTRRTLRVRYLRPRPARAP